MNRDLYTSDLAARVAKDGGGPYRPSNGTEGYMFEELWCLQCTKYSEANPCPILCASLASESKDDPDYPKEWNHDARGQPQCTAFVDAKEAT